MSSDIVQRILGIFIHNNCLPVRCTQTGGFCADASAKCWNFSELSQTGSAVFSPDPWLLTTLRLAAWEFIVLCHQVITQIRIAIPESTEPGTYVILLDSSNDNILIDYCAFFAIQSESNLQNITQRHSRRRSSGESNPGS